MKLEKVESYSQLEVGDLIFKKHNYDNECQVSAFLGFCMENKKVDTISKEFKGVQFKSDELDNFKLAKQNYVDLDYYCYPYLYNLAIIMVDKNRENKKTFEQTIINPECTFAYIKNMVDFMKNGNGLDTQLERIVSSPVNTEMYRIKNVIDKEFVKNYILKIKLMGYLKTNISILSLEDIDKELKRAFMQRKKEYLMERNTFKNALSNPTAKEIIQYGVYFTILKNEKKKYYVCIGHRKEDNVPLFITLPLEDMKESNVLDWLKSQTNYWLRNVLQGRRIGEVKGKELYSTFVQLPVPYYRELTQNRFLTLKSLLVENITR